MPKNLNYKELKIKLDEIVIKLQSNDTDVDEAIELYEMGMKLTKELEDYLKKASNKINKTKIKNK